MNYIVNRLKEEVEDLRTFFSALPRLIERARKVGQVNDWEYPELFKWTRHDSLMSKTHGDEPDYTLMKWEQDAEDEYHLFVIMNDAQYFYKLNMYVGQGTVLNFELLDEHEAYNHTYGFDMVVDLAKYKLEYLEKKLRSLEEEENRKNTEIKEIETRLRSVDTANALMDIFGLKMDNESKQKVQSWKDRIEELKGHDENYRKFMDAIYNK